MPYSAKETIINFIKQAFKEPMIDFSTYNDETFCKNLKLRALEDLSFIMFKIHHDYLRAQQNKTNFNLIEALNAPHPETHICAMDYCLTAGLDEMATRLSLLGAKSENSRAFSAKLEKFYSSDKEAPYIVADIQATIKKVNLSGSSLRPATTQPTFAQNRSWEKLKLTLMDPKFSALLFGLLMATGIASLFFPAISATLLLISMGVTSVLPMLKVYENTRKLGNPTVNVDPALRQQHEDQEIRDLIELSSHMKSAIRHDLSNLKQKTCLANQDVNEHDPETLLFDFLTKTMTVEEIKKHIDLSALNTRSSPEL